MSDLPAIERIFHPYDKWECFHAGFFNQPSCNRIDFCRAQDEYAAFLRDTERFLFAIDRVFNEWPVSCENFLTNNQINRIAWLGQASACIELNLSSAFRGGFWKLSASEQDIANGTAYLKIKEWIVDKNKETRKELCGKLDEQLLLQWDT